MWKGRWRRTDFLKPGKGQMQEAEAAYELAQRRLEKLKTQLHTVKAPSSAETVKALLDRLYTQAAPVSSVTSLSPRYGPPGKPLTCAIDSYALPSSLFNPLPAEQPVIWGQCRNENFHICSCLTKKRNCGDFIGPIFICYRLLGI